MTLFFKHLISAGLPKTAAKHCRAGAGTLVLAGCLAAPGTANAAEAPDLKALLAERYAPFAAEPEALVRDLEPLPEITRYWRSPEELRAARTEQPAQLSAPQPLSDGRLKKGKINPESGGLLPEELVVAIDPGHIGGKWAEYEGRSFQAAADDFPVREGDLVLEVARLLRTRLESYGAEVALLRESAAPVNPKPPISYLREVLAHMGPPEELSYRTLAEYIKSACEQATRKAILTEELQERARRINEVIRPDVAISLHINAVPWPAEGERRLSDSNHAHVLIFGCLTESELEKKAHRQALGIKLANGSGPPELELGAAVARELARATGLPPTVYGGKNAVLPKPEMPYLWARNLLLLREVRCPILFTEPYVANGKTAYARLQAALAARNTGKSPPEDDILVEYAEAVAAGILTVYGE
ncbi:MAG: N-acetylmuramoyl-L-alanine amidase [Opitutales bacterium]